MNRLTLRIKQHFHALVVTGLFALAFNSAQAFAGSSAPFLWRVDVDGGNRHFLLGSIHMMPASIYPLPDALQVAFERTEGLVLETDIDAVNAPELQQKVIGHGLAKQGLVNEIEPDLHDRLKGHLVGLGLPSQLCDAFKAWLCALTLEVMSFQLAGMSPEAGIDQHFADRARSDEREISWLEEPIEQLGYFFDLDQTTSAQFLESALDDLGDPELRPENLVQIWLNNDVSALEKVIQDMHDQYPEAYDQLLAKRNRTWADKLEHSLQSAAPQMIVVGAGHLVGPDNLIALLRARGFAVEPMAEASPSTPLIMAHSFARKQLQADGPYAYSRP